VPAVIFIVLKSIRHMIDRISQSLPDHIIPRGQINLEMTKLFCAALFQ